VQIARQYLQNALALDPGNDGARLDRVAIHLDDGEIDEARQQFDILSPNAEQQSNFESVRARLAASERAATLPSANDIAQAISEAPDNLQARLDLAELHIMKREYRSAMEQFLEVVRRDRAFGDDIGRRKLLTVFEMAAAEPELVSEYRSKLSSVLY
jgi:putative thioredoxin